MKHWSLEVLAESSNSDRIFGFLYANQTSSKGVQYIYHRKAMKYMSLRVFITVCRVPLY